MNATKLIAAILAPVVGLTLIVLLFLVPAVDTGCTPGSGTPAGNSFLPPGSTVKPVDPALVTFTSGFGMRGGAPHQGIDLAGDPGTAIYAYTDGVVADSGPASGFGDWIVLDHNLAGQPASTVYGHIFANDLLVHTGDQVRAGQQIARIGYNGAVDPPGPPGAHLHFELWQGGTRLGGGHAVDPKPVYDTAPAPGPGPAPPAPVAPAPPPAGAELAALPASVGSETHWQIDTIRVARAVHAKYPQIQTIGGWRPVDDYPDHPSGRAADIMIPDYSSGEGIELGNAVVDYLLSNAAAFGIEYLIWRQEYIPVNGQRNQMEDRGGTTANHFDHVHVTTNGHGFPNGELHLNAPDGGSGTYRPGQATSDCTLDPGAPVGDDLAPGSVPPEFAPWLRKAGTLCPHIKPSLLAAHVHQESGFNPKAVSGSRAQGPAQFMPETWPSYGRDDDGNGQVSPFDIGDAVMAQGRYMCAIAAAIDPAIAAGKVKAPNGAAELYLAGYNAGEGAVLSSGGFPSGSADYVNQTRPYVDTILANEPKYAAVNQ